MAKYSRIKGPYVGHSILILDDKRRICLNNKLADKVKQRSKNNILYLYAGFQEDAGPLRLLRLYDEEFYQQNNEELHPGGLEETKLQTNDRLQIPLPFYHFLGFNQEHRYALIIADQTGHFCHLYNLGLVAHNLIEQDEFADFLPNHIEMASSCDKRLKKYLSMLAISPNGSPRSGYEWLAERLRSGQKENVNLANFNGPPNFNGTPNFNGKGSQNNQKITDKFSSPPFLPNLEENREFYPPYEDS